VGLKKKRTYKPKQVDRDEAVEAEAELRERENAERDRSNERLNKAIEEVTEGWKKAIDSAWSYKERVFGIDAKEAFDFFGSDHQFLFDPKDDRCMLKAPGGKEVRETIPGFAMTYNIVAELVQIFGPAIYHRNPVRQANPILPLKLRRGYYVDPIKELQAAKLEQRLNSMIMQMAQPLMEQLIQSGTAEEEAMQQAQQQVMQNPEAAQQLAPIGQMLQQLDQELQEANDRYEFAQAYQQKKLDRAYTIGDVMARLLNYTPELNDLRTECRMVVDETIIKGHGVWLTELEPTPDGSQYVACSNHIPIDDYLIDPDVKREKHAMWVAVRYVEPVWMVEDRHGYNRGTIKGNLCSERQSESLVSGKETAWRPAGGAVAEKKGESATNDLLVYYKLFSKMGLGGRLKSLKDDEVRELLDGLGDNCCVLITNTLKHPINLHPRDVREKDADELKIDLSWPTSYHKIGEWPTTSLMFHWQDCSYGMSHIKPGIGELKFLDYAMSHLANKIRTTSQDLVGVIKSAGEDIKKAFNTTTENGYTIIEIEALWGKSVGEVVSFLQKPDFKGDVWNVIGAVAQRLDKRLGLTEIAYGLSTTQSRSALDAKQKQENFSVRPDDMAACVEEAAKKLAKKEAYCMAEHYEHGDVVVQLGEAGAELYMELVASQPPEAIIRQFDFTIEAGSIRKPSIERDIETQTRNDQTLLPVVSAYCLQTQDMGPLNWYFQRAAEVYSYDASGLVFQSPGSQQPTPEQQQMAKAQKEIAELGLQAAILTAQNNISKIQLEEAKIEAAVNANNVEGMARLQELRHKQELHLEKLREMQEKAAMQLKIDAAEHRQEMQQDAQSFELVKQENVSSGGSPERMRYYEGGDRAYR
jgi:hypothetical protein